DWLSEPGPQCTVGERCYLPSSGKVVDVLNPDGSQNPTVSISRRVVSGFVPDSLAASFVPYAGGNHVVLLEGSRTHLAVGRGDAPALDLTGPPFPDGTQSAGSLKVPTNLRRALLIAVAVLCLVEAAVWLRSNGTLKKMPSVGMTSRGAVVALLLLAFTEAPLP